MVIVSPLTSWGCGSFSDWPGVTNHSLTGMILQEFIAFACSLQKQQVKHTLPNGDFDAGESKANQLPKPSPTKATKTNQRTLPPASPKVATTLIAAKASVGVKDVDGRTEETMKPGGCGGGLGWLTKKREGKFGF